MLQWHHLPFLDAASEAKFLLHTFFRDIALTIINQTEQMVKEMLLATLYSKIQSYFRNNTNVVITEGYLGSVIQKTLNN